MSRLYSSQLQDPHIGLVQRRDEGTFLTDCVDCRFSS
jgi:hypothetical protein